MSGLRDISFRGLLAGYVFSQKALNTLIPPHGTAKLSFCDEHAGKYLEARADNGKLKGEATIKNAKNQVLFELHIANGKITGEYKQWENGRIRREGLLVDCKRQGYGSEYDLSGFLIYEGEYDDDKPTDSDFVFTAANKVKYKCNYKETRGTVIRKRVDYPHYELEVDLKNRPIRFRYVDGDKSLLVRLYLGDNMMLDYANGVVDYEGDFIHDPLKEFRRLGMPDYAYEHSLSPRSIPEKKIESVPVSMEPLEGDLVQSVQALVRSLQNASDTDSDSDLPMEAPFPRRNRAPEKPVEVKPVVVKPVVVKPVEEVKPVVVKPVVEKPVVVKPVEKKEEKEEKEEDKPTLDGFSIEDLMMPDEEINAMVASLPLPLSTRDTKRPDRAISLSQVTLPPPAPKSPTDANPTPPSFPPVVPSKPVVPAVRAVSSVPSGSVGPEATEVARELLPVELLSSTDTFRTTTSPKPEEPVEVKPIEGVTPVVVTPIEGVTPVVVTPVEVKPVEGVTPVEEVMPIEVLPVEVKPVKEVKPVVVTPVVVTPIERVPPVKEVKESALQKGVFFDETTHLFWKGSYNAQGLQGSGALLFEDRSVFQEGAFADGKLTGTGRQYWPSQQVLEKCKTLKKEPVLPQVQFEGSFKDGVLDGRGREFLPAGELVFAGEFKGGKYDGEGTLYERESHLKYEGSFKDGKFDGQGLLTDEENGIEYEGSFVAGQRSGVGQVRWCSGRVVCEGMFAADKLNGEATEFDEEGRVVARGHYRDDYLDGEGIVFDYEKDVSYDGTFANGVFVRGVARSIRSRVVRFEGDFQPNDAADLSAGYHLVHGSVFDANGVVVMEGSFKDGKLTGFGRTFESGVKAAEGNFSDGAGNGFMTWFYPSGAVRMCGGMKNGALEGRCEEFDEAGRTRRVTVFENGVAKSCAQFDAAGRLCFKSAGAAGERFVYHAGERELVCWAVREANGRPDGVMRVLATRDLSSRQVDERWTCVYEGGYSAAEGQLLRCGRGKAFLPDGRVLESVWQHNTIAPGASVTVDAPAPDATHPKRKPGRYYGEVLFDCGESELIPRFCYHGKGTFVFTDGSCFQGVWEQGKLVQYQPICWPNGTVKYNGAIGQFSVSDEKMAHEFLPTGVVQYYPLESPYIIQGVFLPEFNCIGNPIRILGKNGTVLCESTNARYSMCSDNYNVNYGY